MDLMDGFVNNDKFIWCIDNFRKSYCIKMNIVKVKNCYLQQKIWKFDWKYLKQHEILIIEINLYV